MPTRLLTVFAFTSAAFVAGCARDQMMADPFALDEMHSPATAMSAQRAEPGSSRPNTQAAFRQQLLTDQLRQSQLDLQAASTEEERQAVQQRIDTIRRQLERVNRQLR